MKNEKRHVRTKVASLLGALLVTASQAAIAVPFDITAGSFTPGTGYGIDASESSGTLLDVRFTSTFSLQTFVLNLPSPASQTFSFGTVALLEPNAMSGITANEQDNLGVLANFTFVDPIGAAQQVTAAGTATTGSVSDSGVDYTLVWTDVDVAFGSSGLFRIHLDNVSLSNGTPAAINATITLLRQDVDVTTAAVPEPATALLFGLGALGIGFSRRKRA